MRFKPGDIVINPEEYPGYKFLITSVVGNNYVYDIYKDEKKQEAYHFPINKFDEELHNRVQSKLGKILE